MSCNKINSAVITTVLAAGSAASPYYFQVNISQRLCNPTCVNETPVFAPVFTYKSISNVGTGQYVVTIHVEGVISYVPNNGNVCCTKSQVLSQDFTIPIASTAAPTSITVVAGTTVNSVSAVGCQNYSRDFVSETPLTITVA
jgi:hypothetical protein